MAYTKYYAGGWKNSPDISTPIVAAALDTIDAGILTADTTASAAVPKSLVDAAGDLLVGSANDTVTRLAKGADGQWLRVTGGALVWSNIAAADIQDITTRVDVRKNSAGSVFSRRRLNLIEGSNVTLTVADDAGSEEVDITVASAGTFIGARAYHNANQAITTATVTALALNSERFDTDTIHDTVTNNSRLTCKTAGKYLITGSVWWGASTAGTYREVLIRLNGGSNVAVDLRAPIATSGLGAQTISSIYDLSINDYVELTVQQDSGGNLNVETQANYSPEFSMVRIS